MASVSGLEGNGRSRLQSSLRSAVTQGNLSLVQNLIVSRAHVHTGSVVYARAAGQEKIAQLLESQLKVEDRLKAILKGTDLFDVQIALPTAQFWIYLDDTDYNEEQILEMLGWESLLSFQENDAYIVFNENPLFGHYELLLVYRDQDGFQVIVEKPQRRPKARTMQEAFDTYFKKSKLELNFLPFRA